MKCNRVDWVRYFGAEHKDCEPELRHLILPVGILSGRMVAHFNVQS